MELIFRSIFWIGVTSIVVSLFIDFVTSLSYFLLAFLGGIVLVIYSLFEQYLLKRTALPASAAVQQPQPAVVAKRLAPLQEIQQPSPASFPSRPSGFLSRFLRRLSFRKQHHLPLQPLPIASLDNVKKLFTEDPHLQRQQLPGTFQRPASQPAISYQRTISQQPPTLPQPTPAFQQRKGDFLPFEEGLEHYIPTGADQLPHDHHNRYAEDREFISPPSDQRYQQVSQRQRTPVQQPSSHHLSLLHYLHYKDKKHEQALFIILLCLSLILIITSLLLPYRDYVAFVVTLLFLGLTLFSASIAELIHLRRHLPPQPGPHPLAAQQPAVAAAVPSRQKPSQPVQQPLQHPSLEPPTDIEHLTTLIAYTRQSLQQRYPLDAIRAAAHQSGWPDTLVSQAILAAQKNVSKKKKVLVLVGLVVALLILLLVLSSSDMFLLPYWLDLLGDASPQFYFIMIGVFLLIILLFVNKVRKVYKAKNIRYKVEEEQHIAEIKQELQRLPAGIARGTYETDFDRLYKLLAEKQKLTITEVAQGFNISRKEAEEWGKILKEQGLIELHYPTVGDLELLWKK